MPEIDESSIATVLDVYLPERAALVELLRDLDGPEWDVPTECPAYTVKGIATHVLGDDLSLLSRQRDGAAPGLLLVAEDLPGADFRELLDAFNDQWVRAARFLSPALLLELLELAGRWTHEYYRSVDPLAPGEPVPLFDPSFSGPSPYWQAIAREYLERWAHHSQIRRALGLGALADSPFLDVGLDIVATAAGAPTGAGPRGAASPWEIGPLDLGPRQQAAEILTLAHTAAEVTDLVDGPPEVVEVFAARVGRR